MGKKNININPVHVLLWWSTFWFYYSTLCFLVGLYEQGTSCLGDICPLIFTKDPSVSEHKPLQITQKMIQVLVWALPFLNFILLFIWIWSWAEASSLCRNLVFELFILLSSVSRAPVPGRKKIAPVLFLSFYQLWRDVQLLVMSAGLTGSVHSWDEDQHLYICSHGSQQENEGLSTPSGERDPKWRNSSISGSYLWVRGVWSVRLDRESQQQWQCDYFCMQIWISVFMCSYTLGVHNISM